MNVQRKKYAAPIIVTVFVALYYSIAATVLYNYNIDLPLAVKIAVFVVPSIVIIIMMVMVLLERFKEIKKGEADDLGKY
jgi:predicted membrane chloride channel (bestrophin family)